MNPNLIPCCAVLVCATAIAQDCEPMTPNAACSGNGSRVTLVAPGSDLFYFVTLVDGQASVSPESIIKVSGNFHFPVYLDIVCCPANSWEMTVEWPNSSCTNEWEGFMDWCVSELFPPGDAPFCLNTPQSSWPNPFTLGVDFSNTTICGDGGGGHHGYTLTVNDDLHGPTPGDFTMDGVVNVDDLIFSIGWAWNFNGVDGLLEVLENWTGGESQLMIEEWVIFEKLPTRFTMQEQ